jgi:sulfatase maturation enzyme AslB (radical SAM superfamily)
MQKEPEVRPGFRTAEIFAGWGKMLQGHSPLMSIEITRECPLSCPGCYAYGENHLGNDRVLRDLADYRGDDLVNGVLALVRKHRPLHVSLVGGEPLIRHKELSRILPALSDMGVYSMVVTSAVIPIPMEWMTIPRVRVAISVDGIPADHDVRRKPATYEKILKNIAGREVSVHWTITNKMVSPRYIDEFLSYWNARPEVNRIWASIYTPQAGENTEEMVSEENRRILAEQLPLLRDRYPKFLISDGMANAYLHPPENPAKCLFSQLSVNYTADLNTRVEPCIFGGAPDCSQCGCAVSAGLEWIRNSKVKGTVKADLVIGATLRIGKIWKSLTRSNDDYSRAHGPAPRRAPEPALIQINRDEAA